MNLENNSLYNTFEAFDKAQAFSSTMRLNSTHSSQFGINPSLFPKVFQFPKSVHENPCLKDLDDEVYNPIKKIKGNSQIINIQKIDYNQNESPISNFADSDADQAITKSYYYNFLSNALRNREFMVQYCNIMQQRAEILIMKEYLISLHKRCYSLISKSHELKKIDQKISPDPIIIIDDEDSSLKIENNEDLSGEEETPHNVQNTDILVMSSLISNNEKEDSEKKNNFNINSNVLKEDACCQEIEDNNMSKLLDAPLICKDRDNVTKIKTVSSSRSHAKIPPFSLNRHRNHKKSLKCIWNPDVTEKTLSFYFEQIESALGRSLPNEEKVIKLLLQYKFNVDEIIHDIQRNKAFYRRYLK